MLGPVNPREQVRRHLADLDSHRLPVVDACPPRIVPRGHCHVGVAELLRDIPELNIGCQELRGEGVSQILGLTMTEAGFLAHATEVSLPLASRTVSPASCFFPASRKSLLHR